MNLFHGSRLPESFILGNTVLNICGVLTPGLEEHQRRYILIKIAFIYFFEFESKVTE